METRACLLLVLASVVGLAIEDGQVSVTGDDPRLGSERASIVLGPVNLQRKFHPSARSTVASDVQPRHEES
jgi:hypothetical protein